jgi:hypothetical protein
MLRDFFHWPINLLTAQSNDFLIFEVQNFSTPRTFISIEVTLSTGPGNGVNPYVIRSIQHFTVVIIYQHFVASIRCYFPHFAIHVGTSDQVPSLSKAIPLDLPVSSKKGSMAPVDASHL